MEKTMNTIYRYMKHKIVVAIALFFLVQSCATLISPYDHYSYVQTISVKVDALNLMDLATDSFRLHKKEIAKVQSDIQKMYEYEKYRPKNETTTKMWQTIMDTTGNSFAGFIVKWQKDKILNPTYIENKKPQVATSFDQVIQLEAGKIKPEK
jgi:hypothetical protein